MRGFTHGYQCMEKCLIQKSISVNKDSVETISYRHKQDLISVFFSLMGHLPPGD